MLLRPSVELTRYRSPPVIRDRHWWHVVFPRLSRWSTLCSTSSRPPVEKTGRAIRTSTSKTQFRNSTYLLTKPNDQMTNPPTSRHSHKNKQHPTFYSCLPIRNQPRSAAKSARSQAAGPTDRSAPSPSRASDCFRLVWRRVTWRSGPFGWGRILYMTCIYIYMNDYITLVV